MAEPLRLGRYVLERRLAVGGMAEVFLGRLDGPEGFSKPVVIKRVLPEFATNKRFIRALLNEARIGAQLNHANLVNVLGLEEIDGQYCLIMEYVEGRDLRSLIAASARHAHQIPLPIVAAMVAQAAVGLHCAHECTDDQGRPLGVVHRDVAPDNLVLTTRGFVKVVDFGIAKHELMVKNTTAGVVLGKVPYMSPEQATGQRVDPRSDIFSLGAVLYELLTLAPCFERASLRETLEAVEQGAHVPLQRCRPDISPALDAIFLRMIARAPEDRYATALDVALALEASSGIDRDHAPAALRTYFAEPLKSPRLTDHRGVVTSTDVPVGEELSAPNIAIDPRLRERLLTEQPVRDEARNLKTINLGSQPAHGAARSAASLPPHVAEPHPSDERAASLHADPAPLDSLRDTERSTPLSVWAPRRSKGLGTAAAALLVVGLGWFLWWFARPVAPEASVTRALPAAPPTLSQVPASDSKTVVASEQPPQVAQRRSPTVDTSPAPIERSVGSASTAKAMGERMGFLTLDTDPRAEVWLGNRVLGTTPLRDVLMPPGTHTLRIRNDSIGLRGQLEVNVFLGKRTSKQLTFRRGRLAVDARPWADVFLDDRKVATTPVAPFALWEGSYELRLVNPKLEVERRMRVTITAGETTKVHEVLE